MEIFITKHEHISPIDCDFIEHIKNDIRQSITNLKDKESRCEKGDLWWHGAFGNAVISLKSGRTDELRLFREDKIFCKIRLKKSKAYYMETFNGYDYFRDKHGNIYAKIGDEIMYCSNLKRGRLTEDKAEPYYPVNDIELCYTK